MDDLSGKLNALLFSPDSMNKIQRALASLTAESDSAEREDADAPAAQAGALTALAHAPERDEAGRTGPRGGGADRSDKDGGDKSADKGGNLLLKLAPLLLNMDKDDDDTRLLKALKPYLHGEKEKRLDDALQILRFVKVLPLLQERGLF